ncbi:MAG: tetratricopeptide repeat protein [Thermoanaerobaculia bacterium]
MKRQQTISYLLAVLLLGAVAVVEAGWDEGVAAFQAGNYTEAAKQFQTFVDERPDVFQGHYMLGQTLAKLDRNQEAISHLQKALELEPGNVGVQLALGKVYLSAGRYGDAAVVLSKIDSSSLPAAQQTAVHQMMAVALEESGDSDRALDSLARAAKANPNDADIQFQYGAAALRAGDGATAASALAKAVQLDPNDIDKQKTYAQALLRQGRTSRGDAKTNAYKKAATAAQKVVSADGSYDNLMLLAGAQLGAKQYDGALATSKQAAGKNPNDWLPLYYQGQALTQEGQFRTAESTLKQALGKASSSADKVTVWKQLGFVYEKQKSYDQAVTAYQNAGDSASIARVEDNRETDQYNQQIEQENEKIRALAEEEERLKEELKNLPGGPPPQD